MTDATITVIAAGIVTVITAVGTVLVAAINAKLAKVNEKAEVIGAKVDGHLGGLMADLAVEKEKVKGYEAQIAQMEAASQAAQDLALKQVPASPVQEIARGNPATNRPTKLP